MNDCALMQEMISRMLDDDLNADERAALAKHLESCESCRTLYEAFAAVSASFGEELEEPPARLRESVMAEIRREEIRKKNRRPWRAALAAAAVLVVVLGLRAGLMPRMGSASMSASVQEFPAVPAEETLVEEAAAAEEEMAAAGGAVEAAVTEERAVKSAAPAPVPTSAPAPMPTPEAALFAAADAVPAAGAAAQANGASRTDTTALATSPVLDLGVMRFEELLEKLAGVKTRLAIERLDDTPALTLRCADGELALFDYDGALYYYSVTEGVLMRSALTRGELYALAG